MPNHDQANPVTRRTTAYLAKIALENPKLHAFTDVLAQQALATAQALDQVPHEQTGPLHGLNIAVKDNIDTVPAICSAGLPFLQHHHATADATVVSLLRKAGAVILGVTATDAGAFGVTTPDVTNPAMPGHIAGGSSGGSAVAVAAGLCDAALGTDTGGSVRIPAACCGVYGFKPTHEAIPMAGIRPLTQSFDHLGVLAGSVAMIHTIISALAPGLPKTPSPRLPRIAIPWPNLAGTDPKILASLHTLQSILRDHGHKVFETSLPPLDDVQDIHIGLSLAEAAAFYADLPDKTHQNLPTAMQSGLTYGATLTKDHLSNLISRRTAMLAAIDRVFETADYLLLPTLPIQPPRIGTNTVQIGARTADTLSALIRFTAPFNQSGHPALAFPWPLGADGPAFSLQLVGHRNADLSLLEFAANLCAKGETS